MGMGPMPEHLGGTLLAVLILASSGCGGDDDARRACIPGESRACTTTTGCAGAQVCAPDGLSLGECMCEGVDGGPRDAGTPADAGVAGDGGVLDGGAGDGSVDTTHTFPPRDLVCAAGESPACATTEPARSEAERTVPIDEPLDGETLTFVVSSLTVPEPAGEAVPGFNLDGIDSGDGSTSGPGTCVEYTPDHVSPLDLLHVGVDDAQAALVPTVEGLYDGSDCPSGTDGCLDAKVAQAIAEGALLILVEVAGVDSLENDPDVTVSFYLGAIAGGGVPELDGEGKLVPDQELTTVVTLAEAAPGDVFEGRLRTRLPVLDFPDGSASGLYLVGNDLREVEARFDLTTDALTRGALGGHAAVDDVVGAIAETMPGIEATVRTIVESVSDIDPSSGDPTVCTRISVGYALDAVSAVRTP